MKHICLTILLSTATISIANASDVGTGYFEGEFASLNPVSQVQNGWHQDWRRVRDIDGNFGEFELIADTTPGGGVWSPYGESYSDIDEASAYRWGVERIATFNNDLETGIQTWHYDYDWSKNNLSFSGNEFHEQEKGQSFVAGILSYTNGSSRIGSNVDSVRLDISSYSDNVDFDQALFIEVAIDSSPNDRFGEPVSRELAADFIYFPLFPEFGSLRVFEGETGTVEILTEFNSLHFKGFGEVLTPDVAFLSSSLTAVPMPAAMWFFGTGLLGLVGMSKKKYKL